MRPSSRRSWTGISFAGTPPGIEALDRRPQANAMGRHRTPVRPDARGHRICRRRLYEGRARHPRLRHGHHAAPARRAQRAADRQPCAAARQYRTRRRRRLSGARSFQRAGRPHRRHHRRSAKAEFLERLERRFGFKPPSAHGPQRRDRAGGDDPRRGEGLLRDGRQFRRGHSRLAGDAGRAAQARSDRPRLHQAQPQPSDPWPRRADPALPRANRDRRPGNGPQSITVEDSMSMVHASAGRNKPASEHLLQRARDRRRHCQGDARRRARWSTGTALSPTTIASAMRSRTCSRSSRATTPASAFPAAST